MAEYIDRENIIPHSIDDDYEEGGERLIVDYKDIEEMPPADVVERSKIDKTIEEMERYSIAADYESEKEISKAIDKCVEIFKRNIGE